MRMFKLAVGALALLSSAPVLTTAHAASIPTVGLSGVRAVGGNHDWMTTLVQENEGIPNPRHCVPVSRPVADGHRHFIGYQTFNVCN